MGNTSSSPLADCLKSAVSGDASLVATSAKPFYQLADVKPYNLDVTVSPVAVTYPKTADQIAAIIGCASQYDSKVQARGGGHSYANYGMYTCSFILFHTTQASMFSQAPKPIINPFWMIPIANFSNRTRRWGRQHHRGRP